MKLLEIAHSRTGDKGDISNISVIAYDMKDYEFIKEKVTVELQPAAGYPREVPLLLFAGCGTG